MRNPSIVGRAPVALAGAFIATCMLSSAPASAQSDTKASAEVLFERGKELMAAKRLDEACPKFAESLRLERGIGTMLWLADCYEKSGKTASAWAQFVEAQSIAKKQGDSRAEVARLRAVALQPNLPKMRIDVPPASRVTDLAVKRDEADVGSAVWGLDVPVDPGSHTITASAPGYKPWTTTVDAQPGGAAATVTVPALEETLKEHPADTTKSGSGSTLRVVGFVTAAVGAVALGTGLYFGAQAKSKEDDLSSLRTTGGPWDQTAYDDGDSASTLAKVFVISGGVLLATGAVLVVLGISKKEPAASTSSSIARMTWRF